MRKALLLAAVLSTLNLPTLNAQTLKPRPDAFPWEPDTTASKAIEMATTVAEMANWDRYPTYDTYQKMMQQWQEQYPTLCHVDTIGRSVQGRLLLCMVIRGENAYQNVRPEFFYTSTMHGDEVTGYVMMLRLIDTLLSGYGTNQQYTDLVNTVDIYINPLANPDGTYRSGDNTVRGSMRYNANYVDLNRNFPDPFGTAPLNGQQQETAAMIDYATAHHFRLSANLHGGSEVMNYPWDSFTSAQQQHPARDWWVQVCRRFVDTCRTVSATFMTDVTSEGYIAGGDWYVIPNGRQDYMNYYHNCLEVTMEVSSVKTLSSDRLPEYWRRLQHALVNYISEIHALPGSVGIDRDEDGQQGLLEIYPNPTHDKIFLSQAGVSQAGTPAYQSQAGTPAYHCLQLYNSMGYCVMQLPADTRVVDLGTLPDGIYLLRCGNHTAKVVKQ